MQPGRLPHEGVRRPSRTIQAPSQTRHRLKLRLHSTPVQATVRQQQLPKPSWSARRQLDPLFPTIIVCRFRSAFARTIAPILDKIWTSPPDPQDRCAHLPLSGASGVLNWEYSGDGSLMVSYDHPRRLQNLFIVLSILIKVRRDSVPVFRDCGVDWFEDSPLVCMGEIFASNRQE